MKKETARSSKKDQEQKLAADDPRFRRYQAILKDLRILFQASQAHAREVEKDCGLSSAQLWMLWELHNFPGLRVSELAKILTIHVSTCSNLLDKLQAKGMISRKRSASDQRSVHLNLTDKGLELLAKAPRPAQGVLTDALLRLPDTELNYLEVGLDTLVKAIQNIDESDSFKPIDDYLSEKESGRQSGRDAEKQ